MQQPGGWDFSAGIQGAQIQGKKSRGPVPSSPGKRLGFRALSRPVDRYLRGHMRRSILFGKANELPEQTVRQAQLESEAPPQGEVILQVLAELFDRTPPGQG